MSVLEIIGTIALGVIVWRIGVAIRDAIIYPPHDQTGE